MCMRAETSDTPFWDTPVAERDVEICMIYFTWVYGMNLQATSPNFQDSLTRVNATAGIVIVKRRSAAAKLSTKQFVTVLMSGNLEMYAHRNK